MTRDLDRITYPGPVQTSRTGRVCLARLTPLDLDGNARFADDAGTLDTGCFPPAVVDMGAYESQGKPTSNPMIFADLDSDGVVGIIDFLALLATRQTATAWTIGATGCVGRASPRSRLG